MEPPEAHIIGIAAAGQSRNDRYKKWKTQILISEHNRWNCTRLKE